MVLFPKNGSTGPSYLGYLGPVYQGKGLLTWYHPTWCGKGRQDGAPRAVPPSNIFIFMQTKALLSSTMQCSQIWCLVNSILIMPLFVNVWFLFYSSQEYIWINIHNTKFTLFSIYFTIISTSKIYGLLNAFLLTRISSVIMILICP